MDKRADQAVETIRHIIEETALDIWDHPELGFNEHHAIKTYRNILLDHGFNIRDIPDMETAFVAEAGSGKPILGILAEYDALPGLSQKVQDTPEPVVPGGPGHGCGHNLLGAAALGGCLAVADLMAHYNLPGTIRFYGCPAEELGMGKIMMDEHGVFDDLDACFAWHPSSGNSVSGSRLSALLKAQFYFTGRTAHAGAHPELGRSALDAVELMNVGANYLREHIPPGAKLHYIITDGGEAANIVPGKASVEYIVRASDRKQVHEVFERLHKVGRGAAMMTETQVRMHLEKDNFDTLNNQVLEDLVDAVYQSLGDISFSREEEDFARRLVQSLPEENYRGGRAVFGVAEGVYLDGRAHHILGRGEIFGASSDVGQVTYRTPTVQCAATTLPIGVPLHSWQATASAGSSFGLKGCIYMAKIFTRSIQKILLDDGSLLAQARQEFDEEVKS